MPLAPDAVLVASEATTTKEEETPAEVVILTGVTVKDGVAVMPSLLAMVRLTAPVKPLNGVTVKAMPVEVAPGATVTAPVQGVREKSGFEVETKSTDASDPLG